MARGIEPAPVLNALMDQRAGEQTYTTESVRGSVNEGLWEDWADNKETACCPVPRWTMGQVTGKQSYRFHDCDDSWRCPKHAPRRVRRVLAAARRDWLNQDVIYCATVKEDLMAIERVRSYRRPGRKDARSWYVVRRDWKGWSEATTIQFFSTEDLSGPKTRKPPTSWEALLPEEAIERLGVALRLPGVVRVSPKWDQDDANESGFEISEEDPPEDAPRSPESYMALPSVMPGTREQVLEIVDQIVHARHGFTPSEDFLPTDQISTEEMVSYIKAALEVVGFGGESQVGDAHRRGHCRGFPKSPLPRHSHGFPIKGSFGSRDFQPEPEPIRVTA